MTYTVYFETKEHMRIGEEDFEKEHHIFDYVDTPVIGELGLTIYYGDIKNPAEIYFVPHSKLEQVQITRD
jgi:hypothetical protein